MASYMEVFEGLGADLRSAITSVRGVLTEMRALKDSATGNITTIIQQFVTRPAAAVFFVDPTNGLDTNDGQTLDTPLKTVDKAIASLPRDGFSTILLMGDVVVNYYTTLLSPVTFYGIQRGNGNASNTYTGFQRKITFANEATNSPQDGVGRTVACFNVGAPYLRYQFVDVLMGNPAAEVTHRAHHSLVGADLQMSSCNVNAPTPGALSILLEVSDGARSSLWFSGSMGGNMPGKIIRGIAAGANPNSSNYTIQSNLTSV